MKKLPLLISAFFLVLLAVNTFAQKLRAIDKSPMDMAYYPDNFAHDRKGDDKAIVRVIYTRPAKKDREIFGKLEPFNKVWRTGANENTEIKFYEDVKIEGKSIKAGTYSLFTIPNATEWTIIFNSDVDHWGAYSYDEKSDVLRVKVPAKKSDEVVENFTIQFSKKSEKEATMKLAWDTTLVEVSVSF